MHHRRKPDKPLTTTNKCSRIITIRLPHELEAAIKETAEFRGRPWQTVLKELLMESLGLKNLSEVKRISAKDLHEAVSQLKKK